MYRRTTLGYIKSLGKLKRREREIEREIEKEIEKDR